MDKDLDPWTKKFSEEFERKPYYDKNDALPVEPLVVLGRHVRWVLDKDFKWYSGRHNRDRS